MGIKKNEKVGFWVCTKYRMLPKTVSGIQDQLDKLVATNMKLINESIKQMNHINELQSENDRLRSLLNRSSNINTTNSKQQEIAVEDLNEDKFNCSRYPGSHHRTNDVQKRSLEPDIFIESYDIQNPTTSKPKGTLLTGISIIRKFNTKHFQLEIELICVRGGKINDYYNYKKTPNSRM
jgi:paraquat-inducible protein B